MINTQEILQLIVKHPTTRKVINTLVRLGLVDNRNATSEADLENLEITALGKAYLNQESEQPEDDLSWINDYRQLFANKNPSKIGTKQSVINKMRSFMMKYKVTKEEILKATELYLDQLEGYSNNQMSSADYFISYTAPYNDKLTNEREVKSNLLKWIEIYRSNNILKSSEFIEKL